MEDQESNYIELFNSLYEAMSKKKLNKLSSLNSDDIIYQLLHEMYDITNC